MVYKQLRLVSLQNLGAIHDFLGQITHSVENIGKLTLRSYTCFNLRIH